MFEGNGEDLNNSAKSTEVVDLNVQKDFKKYFNVVKFIGFIHSWFMLLVLWLRNLFPP